jgi:hypothetical protein
MAHLPYEGTVAHLHVIALWHITLWRHSDTLWCHCGTFTLCRHNGTFTCDDTVANLPCEGTMAHLLVMALWQHLPCDSTMTHLLVMALWQHLPCDSTMTHLLVMALWHIYRVKAQWRICLWWHCRPFTWWWNMHRNQVLSFCWMDKSMYFGGGGVTAQSTIGSQVVRISEQLTC